MGTNLLGRIKQGSWLSVVKLLTGLVKIKALAILLGVAGLGVFSLAVQYQMAIAAATAMGMSVVIINKGRPHYIVGEYEKVGEIVGASIVALFINSSIVLVIVAGIYVSGASDYIPADFGWGALLAVLLSGILVSTSIVLGEGVCILADKYNLYVKINVVAAILEIPVIFIFSIYFSIAGAVFGIFVASMIQVVAYFFILSRTGSVEIILDNIFLNFKSISIFYGSSVIFIGLALVPQVLPLLARNFLVAFRGGYENGLLQVVTAAEAYLLPFIVAGVTGYLHPIVAETGDCPKSREHLIFVLDKTFPISIAGAMLVVLGVPILIPFVYSQDFSSSEKLFFVYFLFEPFFIMNYIMWMYFMGAQLYKTTLVNNVVYFFALMIVTIFLSKEMGAEAYVYGHAIGSILALMMNVFWLFRNFQGRKFNIKLPVVMLLSYWVVLVVSNQQYSIDVINNSVRLSLVLGCVLCVALYKIIRRGK
jgi:hypothetical protein